MIKYPASMWYAIKERCKENGAHQSKRPKYAGCSIGFDDIDDFKSWAADQPGFGCRDERGRRYHLDKDLLSPGNKVYSREFCVIVPARINTLMLDCGSQISTGASVHKATGKWQARVQTLSGREYLGLYASREDACAAWKSAKALAIESAIYWYITLPGVDQRVVAALNKAAEALRGN